MPNYNQSSPSNELYHYGVKGMRWGHRKAQSTYVTSLSRAKAAYKGDKKRADAAYSRAAAEYDRFTKGGRIESKKADRALDAAADKWGDDRKAAKANYKAAKTQIKRNAVKEYTKKYNAASKASDLADKRWNEVDAQYQALGKIKVTRIINAARNKTAAAKQYSKNYEEASRMSDAADKLWAESKAAYRETGRNYVERVFNNIKYRK